MRLTLMCSKCGTFSEWDGGNTHHYEIQSTSISHDSDFRFEITASISGIDDVQESEFDESDLSIEDKKAVFNCVGCNSSIAISE